MPRLHAVAALALGLAGDAAAAAIALNGAARQATYAGHGALSAGASSRLLWDYEPALASDILDLLFKPNFGMSLHQLKVEVGGDDMSTDGSEPSHMHARDDLSCERGYEFWLLEQAVKRNPSIQTYALAWGVPQWVGSGNYFSQDNIDYHIAFLRCARARANVTLGHLGIWNERAWGSPEYVVSLRQALDAAGFAATRIVLADDGAGSVAGIVAAAQANATFAAAFDTVGVHYPCDSPAPAVGQLGKQFWASEDWWSAPDWDGAGCWGRRANMNFIVNNMTANIAWSLVSRAQRRAEHA